MKIAKTLVVIFLALPLWLPAQTVTITSPNGNENWVLGSPHDITWTQSGLSGKVTLFLRQGDVGHVIASDIPVGNLKYPWTAGQYQGGTAVAGTDYRVHIRVDDPTNGPFYDKSNHDFTLSASDSGSEGLKPVPVEMRSAIPFHATPVKAAKTVSLQPSVANKWYRKHSWTGFNSASEPTPDPKPQMRTGYSNSYSGPTWQTTDWEYWGYIYRGILKFDFSQIKGKVTEAKLAMICSGTDSNDGTPYCDGSVYVLDGPGSGFDNPCHLYVNLPASGGNVANDIIKVAGPNIIITLTDLVKGWINGQQPNHGLRFLGNNETMDDESNNHCISHFFPISLSVTYIPD